ncbi:MAG TPA: amidase [Candidatus Binatia bacterium]|nr:amidase [Candidatus Binatia bacterium]
MPDAFSALDATAQANLVRRREVSPLELVDAAIARIEHVNPALNAVITPLFEKARAQAQSGDLPNGPFRGVPFLLKDIGAHSAGDPFHAGMRALRDRQWSEAHDTHLAAKFRAAGFIFVGKTNTPELGLLPTTEPAAYGATRNPWDPARSPGGSSGGAAAAVASRMVPAAHATDGGGSIRIPASHCGLVGLKTSRGRVSLGPDVSERWAGCAVENSVTRSVRDTAAILDAIAGYVPGDPYTAPAPAAPFTTNVGADPGRLRIGFTVTAPSGMPVDRECAAAVESAAQLLASLGHTLEPSYPAALGDNELTRAFGTLLACATAHAINVWSGKTGQAIDADGVEPMTWIFAELGRQASSRDYLHALQFAQQHARRITDWWAQGFDLLLTPTTAEPPPLLGSFASTPDNPLAGLLRATPFSTFTSAFNLTGQPAISLPLAWTETGLPIGIQLIAAYAREDLLIRVASQLERARPWIDRLPAVHA